MLPTRDSFQIKEYSDKKGRVGKTYPMQMETKRNLR